MNAIAITRPAWAVESEVDLDVVRHLRTFAQDPAVVFVRRDRMVLAPDGVTLEVEDTFVYFGPSGDELTLAQARTVGEAHLAGAEAALAEQPGTE